MVVTINNKKRNQNRKKITLDDIRSTYFEEKRKSDRDDPWLYFVVRPISYYPTWLFLKLGVSANKVTFIGLLIGLVGCVFLAVGSYWAAIIGAILVNIRFLFDVIDGNVARYTDSCTKYGTYIDGMTTYIMAPLMFIAIGIGLFNNPDHYLNSFAHFFFGMDIDRTIYLILGVLGAFISISGFLVTASLGSVFFIKPVNLYKPKAWSKRSLWSIMFTFGIALMGMIKPILILAAVANFLSIFILLWTLITVCYFITVTTRALIMAKKIGGTPDE